MSSEPTEPMEIPGCPGLSVPPVTPDEINAARASMASIDAFLYPPVPDFGDTPMTDEMRRNLDDVVQSRYLHKHKFGVKRLPTKEEILSFIRTMKWPSMEECARFFDFKKIEPNRMSIDLGTGPRTVAVDHDPDLVQLILKTVQDHPDSEVKESLMACMLSDGVRYNIPDAPYLPLVFYMPPL